MTQSATRPLVCTLGLILPFSARFGSTCTDPPVYHQHSEPHTSPATPICVLQTRLLAQEVFFPQTKHNSYTLSFHRCSKEHMNS